ncbi:MAG: amino acid adenylation domain-containing protein [Synechococcaceae cyanobacterium SM2_3_1]|nr:amino acid adenylation domain-containing protein [Synechococcaceae cyanobacterium SM2_3_1]
MIGSPIANRTRVELEPLIGFFVNTLVLRIRVQDGLTFRQLVAQVREVCLQAFAHQDLPFEQLVRQLNLERDLSLPPLVQAAFALENDPLPLLDLPDLTMTPLEVDPQVAKTDLTLYIYPGSEGYGGAIEYNTDLFADATITRLIHHFQQLLNTAVSNPDQAITNLGQAIRPPLSRHTPFGATQLAFSHTLHPSNLSANQLLIWLGQQLDLQSPVYNNAACSVILGAVDPELFQQAFQSLIATADALRTVIEIENGIPQQKVLPNLEAELEYWDAASSLEQVDLEAYLERSARQPFDLSQPLWKSTLIQLAPDQFLWFTRAHQIIADGISVQLILEAVDQIYTQQLQQGTNPAIPLEPLQSFLQDEKTYRHSSRYDKDQAFWDQEFSSPVQPLSFYGRSAWKMSQNVSRISYPLAPEICHRLHEMATKAGEMGNHRISLPHFLLTVFLIYLHKISGSEEICIGIPFHNRLTEKYQRTIGALMQVVPLRTSVLPNDSVTSLSERIKRKSLQTLYHGQYTIRNSQPSPIYDTLFNYHISQRQSFQNWKVESKWIHSGYGYESLALQIHDFADSGLLTLDFDFHCDVFPESLRPVAVDHFLNVLDLCLKDPEHSMTQISLLAESENQIFLKWNGEQQQTTGQCIHKLFEAQVQQTPDAIAVIRGQESLTYRDLNARANQLAHHLQSLGVGPEVLVGLSLERSLEMLVGLLGILKAGGAYVPLDPTYPQERLQFMIADAHLTVLLTQTSLRKRIPFTTLPQLHVIQLDQDWPSISTHPPSNPEGQIHPEHLAYVIYTSGSTGKPKGVMVEHQALTSFTRSAIAEYQITASDRVLQFASLSFDAAVEEIFISLSTGATLILRTEEMLQPEILIQKCLEWQITVLDLPTAFWTLFCTWWVKNQRLCQQLRLVIIGGEKVPWDSVQLWWEHFGTSPQLINSYGPTETTVVATTCLLTPTSCLESEGREIPIGTPLPHVQVYILDPDLQPVPIGMPGELYLGGTGLARGYWQRPDLTAQSFIANPFSQGRLYKTGDLARSRADGMIEYLGRTDQQVKIRGFRIELSEIEAVLHRHEQVQQAVVVVQGEQTENPHLVAYVVAHSPSDLDLHTLKLDLQQQLPAYMIPRLLRLEAFPLTANGKINREALPLPSTAVLTSQPYIPPRTPVELKLTQLWSELFQKSRISVLDHFFDLGGHSLLAIRLSSRIAETFGRPLPLSTLLQKPTIEKLAIWLTQATQPISESVLVPLQPQGQRVPLFCIHPAGGNALCYSSLLPHLPADQPIYGLQSQGLLTGHKPFDQISKMARDYREAIHTIQPQGPYQVLGWSMGGVIAYEIAQQLQQLGEPVKT